MQCHCPPFVRPALGALAVCLAATTLLAPSLEAQLSDIEIHGFGGWAYGDTDGLTYDLGDADGTYDNANFALNIAARPTDRLSIVAQVFLESGSGFEEDQEEVELDYAFAEWFVSDALKIRMGRVKHPFGIYGEIFDVGTLRPFYRLPHSVYGPVGFTAKAYNGVGLTGSHTFGSGWGLQYDLYGGEIEGDFENPGLLTNSPDVVLEPKISLGFTIQDTLGARVNLLTPVQGLSFGVSAYGGDEDIGLNLLQEADRDTHLVHGEYVAGPWSIRAEGGKMDHGGEFKADSAYLEVAYRITDHWQVAARQESWDAEVPNLDLGAAPAIYTQLLEHDETSLGVNYWFSANFVLRLNYHRSEGNRFAFVDTSEEVLQALATGQLEEDTELWVIGAQFSF